MHAKDTAANLPADLAELVLTELPNGQCAWLRPAPASPIDRYRLTDQAVIVDLVDDPRYVLTAKGRKAIAS